MGVLFYAIQDPATGLYLPNILRGTSWIELDWFVPLEEQPRLFGSEKKAANWIRAWRAGGRESDGRVGRDPRTPMPPGSIRLNRFRLTPSRTPQCWQDRKKVKFEIKPMELVPR